MSFSAPRTQWLIRYLMPGGLTHIVDVGANPIEPVPYGDLLKMGGCKVTGFEPGKVAFEKLQKIKGPNEEYHNFAVGDGQRRKLFFTKHDSMTSFYKGDFKSCDYLRRFGGSLEVVGEEDLDTVALDQSPVRDFQLLKIDIQGGEAIVFQGAASKLARAVAVIPEVRWYQLYEGEPMFAGLDSDLRARGFALHKFMFNKGLILPTSQYKNMNHAASANQLIDGDAVYIRDLKNADAYSDNDLKHLAILSDAVWFSFDLTIRCLDMLVKRGAVEKTAPRQYLDRLPDRFKNETHQAAS